MEPEDSNSAVFAIAPVLCLDVESTSPVDGSNGSPLSPAVLVEEEEPSFFSRAKAAWLAAIQDTERTIEEAHIPKNPCFGAVASRMGDKGVFFFAAATSHRHLVLRTHGRSCIAQVRVLPWFKDKRMQIAAMDFSPHGDWLMIVMVTGSVCLVPSSALLLGDSHASAPIPLLPVSATREASKASTNVRALEDIQRQVSGSFSEWSGGDTTATEKKTLPPDVVEEHSVLGAADDVTMLAELSCSPHTTKVCLWWRTCHGIVGDTQGSLSFVNMRTRAVELQAKFKFPVQQLSLVREGVYAKHLLIGGTKGVWKLMLEQPVHVKKDTHRQIAILTLAQFHGHPPFLPERIQSISQDCIMQPYHGHRVPLVGVHHPEKPMLEVYDAEMRSKYPLFEYNVGVGVRQALLDPHFIFLTRREEERDTLVVYSRWMATSRGDDDPPNPKAKLATFVFDQPLLGLLAVPMPARKPEGEESDDQGSQDDQVPCPPWPMVLVWTKSCVYECRLNMDPHVLFAQVLEHDAVQAEALGKTFGLNVLELYENAAAKAFEEDNFVRAVELYRLSNVDSAVLAGKFIEAGRVRAGIGCLRDVLEERSALAVVRQRHLSDVLFRCYVHEWLTDEKKGTAEEFHRFVMTNRAYDAGKAMLLLAHVGMTEHLMQVAHARNLVPTALRMLLKGGRVRPGDRESSFLEVTGHQREVSAMFGGAMLRSLPPGEQVSFLLSDPAVTPKFFRRLEPLLPLLNERELLMLARAFDPDSENHKAILRHSAFTFASTQERPVDEEMEGNREEGAQGPEQYVELFLATLIRLAHIRMTSTVRTRPLSNPPPSSMEDAQKVAEITEATLPRMLTSPTPLAALERRKWVGGDAWDHVAFVTSRGEVWTMGANFAGQLGHGCATEQPMGVRVIAGLRGFRIRQVACGAEHTIAVSDTGDVWSFGRGRFGQLGHGDTLDLSTPQRITSLQNQVVVRVACGGMHTALICESGEVYMFGWGAHGQLGIQSRKDMHSPTAVTALAGQRIVDVACGYCHTVCLAENGSVWCFGSNQFGQLGLGHTSDVLEPACIVNRTLPKASVIECGAFHTLAVRANDGVVLTWGRQGGAGRLGRMDETADILEPRVVGGVLGRHRVVRVAGGHWHSSALTEEGVLWTWGCGERGQTGHGDTKDHLIPEPVAALEDTQVMWMACAEEAMVCGTQSGRVLTWGQFANADTSSSRTPQRKSTRVISFAEESYATPPTQSLRDRVSTVSRVAPTSHSVGHGPEYGQLVLESVLQTKFRSYRPSVVLRRCVQANNLLATAVVYECLGDHSEALSCRMAALDADRLRKKLVGEQGRKREMDTIMSLMTSCVLKSGSDLEAQAAMLQRILKYWSKREFDVQPLEEHIFRHMDILGLVLGDLLEKSEDDPPWCLAFSHKLYIAVVQHALEKADAASETSVSRVPESRLWSEISSNLDKATERRARVAASTTNMDKEMMVFTSLLPEFSSRMRHLRPARPHTTRLIMADYRQQRVSQACPACVYNHLRAATGGEGAKVWEV